MSQQRTRAEHMAWCKQRALEYVERGNVTSAIASMLSDLGKHPDTAAHSGIHLAAMMMLHGMLKEASEVREFIEGFN